MSEAAQSTVWLTQEAFDKLSEELEQLKGEGRRAVSAKIAQARDEGDLSENGGYHAAREEQSKNEGRIAELKQLLETARVGETALPASLMVLVTFSVSTPAFSAAALTFAAVSLYTSVAALPKSPKTSAPASAPSAAPVSASAALLSSYFCATLTAA